MSVQPACALQKQIHRAKFRYHKIKIKVKRLFKHLRSDNYQSVSAFRGGVFAHTLKYLLLALRTIRHYELRMHDNNFGFRESGLQFSRNFLCFSHGIDYHAHTPAAFGGIACPRSYFIAVNRFNGDFLLFTAKGKRLLLYKILLRVRQQGISKAALPRVIDAL